MRRVRHEGRLQINHQDQLRCPRTALHLDLFGRWLTPLPVREAGATRQATCTLPTRQVSQDAGPSTKSLGSRSKSRSGTPRVAFGFPNVGPAIKLMFHMAVPSSSWNEPHEKLQKPQSSWCGRWPEVRIVERGKGPPVLTLVWPQPRVLVAVSVDSSRKRSKTTGREERAAMTSGLYSCGYMHKKTEEPAKHAVYLDRDHNAGRSYQHECQGIVSEIPVGSRS